MRGRLHAALATAVLTGGCNLLLGLDAASQAPGDDVAEIDAAVAVDATAIDAPATDAAPDPHDEDGDLVDDAVDRCPGLADDQSDGDGDGVGDACDPNVNAKGDVLLYFDSFATDDGHWTGLRGQWVVANDSLEQTARATPAALAVGDYDLLQQPDLSIEIVFSVTEVEPWNGTDLTAARGLGLWFVATGGDATNDPNGYLCQPTGDLITPSTTIAMFRVIGPLSTQLDADMLAPPLPIGATGRLRASRIPAGPGFLLCSTSIGDDISSTLTSSDGTFASGGVALRTLGASVRFHSIAILGRSP